MNIVTGGASGTYIQIGKDIAAIAAECGVTLRVNESAGSIENVMRRRAVWPERQQAVRQ